jgi:hypothetical protein
MASSAETTIEWCEERDHPWVTYNPLLDGSFCRCGARRVGGEQPMDWEAKREVFHSCGSDECRCYASTKHTDVKEAA